MSQRCDKHRYSHSSESSCRQCLIDEQADTIAEMKKEALVVEVLTNGKDKLIASMEAHGSALQTECENAKKYMLELSQSITSVSIEKKALQERIAELEKAARDIEGAYRGGVLVQHSRHYGVADRQKADAAFKRAVGKFIDLIDAEPPEGSK
jgi:hypothetical protein